MIGKTLGHKYRILGLLGEGGMGAVYEAEQQGEPERVAVKVIHARHLMPDSDAASRFRREARAIGAIDSEHIVSVLDAGADEATGVLYLVMERLSGQDMQQRVDHAGPLRIDGALCVAAHVLMGLAKAHEAGIVHRDIKPANIFLARRSDGAITVKLLDFGIAKILADPMSLPHTAGLTTTSRFLGSPLYMSPEQVQSSRDVDDRTDLWSLGSALYCALAGRAPYAHVARLVQLIVDISTVPPPPLLEAAPWVPPAVAKVVHCALEQKVDERYPSAAAMLEAILRLLPGGVALREEMLEPLGGGTGAPHELAIQSSAGPAFARIVVNPCASRSIRGDGATEMLVGTLSKLIGLGRSAGTAEWSLDIVEDVQSLVAAGLNLADLRDDDKAQEIAVRQLVLVIGAFGEALNRSWYGDRLFAPGTRAEECLKKEHAGEAPSAQIMVRLRGAAEALQQVAGLPAAGDPDLVTSLMRDPLQSLYYRCLWRAFVAPNLASPGGPPLIMPDSYRQFERHFRLAYAEGLTSACGEEIRRYLISAGADRTSIIRELLLRDMVSWGSRHLFGNAGDHPELPRLPLAAMYVEPDAGSAQMPDEPVLSLLLRLVEQHSLVVVRADFGHGKSLSARMLAQRLATSHIETDMPSSDAWLPLRVRCAEDFESPGDTLEEIVRRAVWRHASSLALDLAIDDPAFEMPGRDVRTLFLIDGLDEVALSGLEAKTLFQRIRQHAGAHRRFVVFSRPAALPPSDHLRGIPVLDLRPFRRLDRDGSPGGQVGEWLTRWNLSTGRSPALRAGDLAARGLLEISKTPILLFMIAHSWDAHTAENSGLADIYEGFIRQMARGKYALDTDRNQAVALASEQLRDRLRDLRYVGQDADPPEAMLWLMGRVAWQAKCLEDAAWLWGRGEVLDTHHVRDILGRELKLDDARVEQTIHIGLLLTLQASFKEEPSRILFGHKSFRELLASRYWASRLRLLIQDDGRGWEFQEHEPLLAGGLLSGQDETFRFLKDQLATWSAQDRQALVRWAQRCFNDQRSGAGASDLWSDRRPLLREAALAIGSAIAEGSGITAQSPETLRSMLAWFWVREEVPLILAPRLTARAAKLKDATLDFADLRGASLARADLSGARMTEALLREADLVLAKLGAADLRGADLSDADLSGTDLVGANLSGANLHGASLRGANLRAAHLRGANLESADLRAANLTEADFSGASLRRANLRRALLQDADMRGADLTDAKLDPGIIEALRR